MKTEHNKKLPEIDAQKEKFEFTYPYFTCEQDDNGKYHFAFHDPENPKNSTLIEMDHNGGYRATMPDDGASKGDGINVSMNPGHTAEYISGGSSNHTDGHTDYYTGDTHQSVVSGDMQHQSGGSAFSSAADKIMHLTQDFFKNIGAGGAESKEYHTSKGDVIEQHSGHKHTEHEGDKIEKITGNKHLIIEKGESGIHLQKGNMDIQLDKGKYRVWASDKIIIESKTMIYLQVGNSYISIQPDGIEISTNGFMNVITRAGSQNFTLGHYGGGRLQAGTDGSLVLAGGDITIKSTTGTKVEKGKIVVPEGFFVLPLAWGGMPPPP
jgi:hypothetical protein